MHKFRIGDKVRYENPSFEAMFLREGTVVKPLVTGYEVIMDDISSILGETTRPTYFFREQDLVPVAYNVPGSLSGRDYHPEGVTEYVVLSDENLLVYRGPVKQEAIESARDSVKVSGKSATMYVEHTVFSAETHVKEERKH